MLQRILAVIALILLGAAYLSYQHLRPWVTFNSEMLACLAAIVGLSALACGKKNQLPLRLLPLFALAVIPLLQYSVGLIFFKSIAILQFAYLSLFASMVVVGYNAAYDPNHRVQIMQALCWMLLVTGLLSSGIAVLQWLQQEQHFFYMMSLSNSRPYANFAQPNNFCTFAIMALLANLYLAERRQMPFWLAILTSSILIFAIVLTQSRTAWLTLPFICLYWHYKQQLHVQWLKSRYLWAGLLIFMVLIALLPSLNSGLNHQLGIEAVKTASAAARASGGHERLIMWQQMFAALQLQPWTGYGWGQVAYAQSQVLADIPLKIWFNSGHNLLLDILVVNGWPLGLLILSFLGWWLWQLHRYAKSMEAVVAMLMIAAILIHAMLEYPQRYAYFLLPMGLLLGIAQAQHPNLRQIHLPRVLPALCVVIGLGLWGMVWRDYGLAMSNIKAARVIEKQRLNLPVPQYDRVQAFVAPHQLYVLDQFTRNAYWISLNPFNKMPTTELAAYGQVVAMAPSRKNLFKYAQLLAYNGQKHAAQQQLKILYNLYAVQVDQNELLQRNAL